VRSADSGSISCSEFTDMVEPDMSVELSIIVRQTIMSQEDKEKCLRCGFLNSVVTPQDGWIKWQVHFRFCMCCICEFTSSIPVRNVWDGSMLSWCTRIVARKIIHAMGRTIERMAKDLGKELRLGLMMSKSFHQLRMFLDIFFLMFSVTKEQPTAMQDRKTMVPHVSFTVCMLFPPLVALYYRCTVGDLQA
jgi:hypothetical protein